MKYTEMTIPQLQSLKKELDCQYAALQAKQLKLDMNIEIKARTIINKLE